MSATTIPFFKYHALGNDYIVMREQDTGVLDEQEIVRICHRNFGLGSDGILLDMQVENDQCAAVKIFNPDGSEAEKSGNGLRIFSRYLWDTGRVGQEAFEIQTLGGRVLSRVLDAGSQVRVAMGRVSFQSEDISMSGEAREVISEPLVLENGQQLEITAASIGNPHCIVLVPNPSPALAKEIGPLIENHQSFLARTNVQFARVISRDRIQIEIWERGAGYTLASGSSASATAAVIHRLGLVNNEVTVIMPGGLLSVLISDDYQITMQGDVTRVALGDFYREAFQFSIKSADSEDVLEELEVAKG